jgi:hypothetical protein
MDALDLMHAEWALNVLQVSEELFESGSSIIRGIDDAEADGIAGVLTATWTLPPLYRTGVGWISGVPTILWENPYDDWYRFVSDDIGYTHEQQVLDKTPGF